MSLYIGNTKAIDVNDQTPLEKEVSDQTLYQKSVDICAKFIENPYFVGTMIVLTLWSLFSDDIRLAACSKDSDLGFELVISIIFWAFIFEIIGTVYCKPEYFKLPEWNSVTGEALYESLRRKLLTGSFYFWLDVLATVSLIFELPWIIEPDHNTNQATTAGNSSRIGSRTGRILRLIRLFRLVRMFRILKYLPIVTRTRKSRNNKQDDLDYLPESHVGAKMSDLTNQRVIILVLSMLIVIPALTITETDLTLNLATRMINRMAILNATNSSVYSEGLTFAISNVMHNSPVIRIVFTDSDGNNLYYQDPVIHSLRREEILTYYVDNSDPYLVTTLQFNSKYNSIQNAVYEIYTTFFVMFLLVCGTYFFSNDVKKLVIKPIERMVELVRDISANPLGVEYKMLGAADGFHEGLETTVLLSTITKIGGLMRVGFGEAGASVIARNLEESSGGKLNLMGTGTMINSIFGFCDIRNFTDTTECLQEEVMLFVNRIAHILHGIVVQCSGSANKNIGDAFLLTWKIDESVLNTPQSYFLADQALLAFLKTLVELIRHEDFICNFSTAATTRLYKRFPGYNVRIGCGLHYGWAIEGAIGSNRKIDASYLSPHVNFTEFLESSTKTYDVPLLMSEPFYRMLSPIVARYCRQVDRIRRTEAEAPVSLYTYDADLSINFSDFARKRLYGMAPRKSLQPTTRPALKRQTETKIDKKVHMLDVESNFSGIAKNAPTISLPPYTPDIWDTDDDLLELRHKTTGAEFRKKWPQGISDYLQGNWVEAAQCFRRTLELTNNQDGPSKFLLKVMSETNFEAPEDWPGYRIEGGGH